jgi:phenol hydroxylase P0 protein
VTTERFDPRRKFVRVVELRPDGFVEFEFAIGEPELFVEMILPARAFDDFCAHNAVTFLGEQRAQAGDPGWDWRLHDATHKRLR